MQEEQKDSDSYHVFGIKIGEFHYNWIMISLFDFSISFDKFFGNSVDIDFLSIYNRSLFRILLTRKMKKIELCFIRLFERVN